MPIEGDGSWVEHWLERFCEPGTHELVPLTSFVDWCVTCGKKAFSDGATCFFCDIPSNSKVSLIHHSAVLVESPVCVLCLEDLQHTIVRGWAAAHS